MAGKENSEINYKEVKSLFGCWTCYPKLCTCICPHGIGLSQDCRDCERFNQPEIICMPPLIRVKYRKLKGEYYYKGFFYDHAISF